MRRRWTILGAVCGCRGTFSVGWVRGVGMRGSRRSWGRLRCGCGLGQGWGIRRWRWGIVFESKQARPWRRGEAKGTQRKGHDGVEWDARRFTRLSRTTMFHEACLALIQRIADQSYSLPARWLLVRTSHPKRRDRHALPLTRVNVYMWRCRGRQIRRTVSSDTELDKDALPKQDNSTHKT
jgi:hypothetical protein